MKKEFCLEILNPNNEYIYIKLHSVIETESNINSETNDTTRLWMKCNYFINANSVRVGNKDYKQFDLQKKNSFIPLHWGSYNVCH